MSQALNTAYACGWSLATSLMTCVVVFRAGADDFGIYLNSQAVSQHSCLQSPLICSSFLVGFERHDAVGSSVRCEPRFLSL